MNGFTNTSLFLHSNIKGSELIEPLLYSKCGTQSDPDMDVLSKNGRRREREEGTAPQ